MHIKRSDWTMKYRTVQSFSATVVGICALSLTACSQSHTAQHPSHEQSHTEAVAASSISPAKNEAHAVVTASAVPHVAATTAMSKQKPAASVALAPARPVVHLTTPVAKPAIRVAGESLKNVVIRSPHAPPQIVRISLRSASVTSGETVRAFVYTTSNTASVEARLYGYSMPLQRVGVGHFLLVYTVPEIPSYLKRSWPVQVIARNADGAVASKQLTISVH